MADDLYAVLMAGGGGTRLWPVSRRERPKQALALVGDQTLFQGTVSRLAPLLPVGRVLVVTVQAQVELLQAQAPTIPDANFIVEPAGRGTAAVVGLAAVLLRRRDPDAVMACLPADHYIGAGDQFLSVLRSAHALARRGSLVTLGIPPTYAATGYGYIERGEDLGDVEGRRAFRVVSFKEKPAPDVAVAYLTSGRYMWNAGMFVWRASAILAEIERQMPDLHRLLQQVDAAASERDREAVVARLWPGLKPQTVDYGIMEGARDVAMVPADGLGWVDVGSWERLFEVLKPDAQGNLVVGKGNLLVDSTGCLVYRDDPAAGGRLVTLFGVRDMIVIETNDVVLMCPRAKAEEIRRLVERIAAEGRQDLL